MFNLRIDSQTTFSKVHFGNGTEMTGEFWLTVMRGETGGETLLTDGKVCIPMGVVLWMELTHPEVAS